MPSGPTNGFSVTTGGVIATGVAGSRIRVHAYGFTTDVAGQVSLTDGTSTFLGPMKLAVGTPFVMPRHPEGHFICASGADLTAVNDGSSAHTQGTIEFTYLTP